MGAFHAISADFFSIFGELFSFNIRGQLLAPLPPRGSTAHLGYWGLHYGFFQVCLLESVR